MVPKTMMTTRMMARAMIPVVSAGFKTGFPVPTSFSLTIGVSVTSTIVVVESLAAARAGAKVRKIPARRATTITVARE
jgi:hypothetical protein